MQSVRKEGTEVKTNVLGGVRLSQRKNSGAEVIKSKKNRRKNKKK